jgi:hypothetical protein
MQNMKHFKFGGYMVVLCASVLASQSQAGLVGQTTQFTWLEGTTIASAESFVVSNTTVEYYNVVTIGMPAMRYAGFEIDFREDSLTLRYTGVDGPGGKLDTTLTFVGSNTFTWTIPPAMAFAAFNFISSNNVSNLSASDLSFLGNTLTIDMSDVVLQQPGATYTLGYTTVPAPSGVALLFGCGLSRFGRKRRR